MTDTSYYAGPSWKETATPVAFAAFEEQGALAVGLADGRIIFRLLDKPETQLSEVRAHQGGLCSMALAGDGEYLFSAGEDGRLVKLAADGTLTEFAQFQKAWLEHLCVLESGLVAVGFKKTAALLGADGKILAEFSNHPSSLGGLAIDAKGKRLAVSHYGGVTLWWTGGGVAQQPQRLNWKGSHLDIAFSPNGKFLLTSMQENTIHGWRISDMADFAMSGYARKPRFHFNSDGNWLATSGSPGIVCWDCSGKGPMGRSATILGQDNPELTLRVACHPELPLGAAGTEKGSVYLARFEDERIVNMKTTGQSEITLLSWSASGHVLLAGAEDGTCYAWPFVE